MANLKLARCFLHSVHRRGAAWEGGALAQFQDRIKPFAGAFGGTSTAARLPKSVAETEQSLARLDALARVMDSAFTIPGTNVTMGVDALLGLLPGIGDAIAATISSYLIWEAKQLGAPKLLLARMAGNVAVDTVVGSVPLVGDIFDVAYKANRKNVALLRRHLEKQGFTGRGSKTIEGEYERV